MKPIRKQRVLILLPVLDLGGAEKQGFYIARSLHNSGRYEITVASLQEGTGSLRFQLEEIGLIPTNLNIPFQAFHKTGNRLIAYWRFLKFLRKQNIAIVLPFTYHCNVLSASVFRFAGVKTCLWFQIAMEYHLPLSTFEKIAIKFKPVYAANSIAAARFIAQKHGTEESVIHFIPNPFEPKAASMSRIQWREKLGIKSQDTLLVMAANFFHEKDHGTLIRGFAKALRQIPSLKLVLAGDDSNGKGDWVRSLCFEEGLSKMDVIFTGSITDVPGLIEASDICLLTSVSEGSPNALIEYLGYGKPVVVSAIPSILELTGTDYLYQFETGNAEDLAGNILSLQADLDSPYTLHRVTDLKKKILMNYSLETNLQAFEKIWKHY
jgi:glycosyltransferase involved in cell wall biosynthesis